MCTVNDDDVDDWDNPTGSDSPTTELLKRKRPAEAAAGCEEIDFTLLSRAVCCAGGGFRFVSGESILVPSGNTFQANIIVFPSNSV